jgi:hypothetical protein
MPPTPPNASAGSLERSRPTIGAGIGSGWLRQHADPPLALIAAPGTFRAFAAAESRRSIWA